MPVSLIWDTAFSRIPMWLSIIIIMTGNITTIITMMKNPKKAE
ncbi:hypothetical protein FSS13T_07460 [Flavobacterium saliperosum S13]|uniref:Uncharacterized protein n=1 Tax=Flavobacterium saliperosum S13 TaxID=1341155 RepID=A0ABN0QIH8_9FLAO|nr:hypothetical protein FSS13T_07460 [Flavobacterium saliperosum S13]